MTVKLVTNEKVAETSSKGNQEKWFDKETNKWYKLDQFGYEALTETIISKLLEKSNIESDTPFCPCRERSGVPFRNEQKRTVYRSRYYSFQGVWI